MLANYEVLLSESMNKCLKKMKQKVEKTNGAAHVGMILPNSRFRDILMFLKKCLENNLV